MSDDGHGDGAAMRLRVVNSESIGEDSNVRTNQPKTSEWYEAEFLLTSARCESAVGYSRSGGREPVGIDLSEQLLLKACHWDGKKVPVLLVPNPSGLPLVPDLGQAATADGESPSTNLIYFARTFSFHPGAVASALTSPVIRPDDGLPDRSGRIFVVDTGWGPDVRGKDDRDMDPMLDDVVFGHGPAIVQLITDLVGGQAEVHLRQIDFFKEDVRDANNNVVDPATIHCMRDTNGNPCIPVFEGQDYLGNTIRYRGFDTPALMSTLRRVEREVEKGDVVNLSIGTVACPDDLHNDPVAAWVRRVTHRGVDVVVAAGNHECDIPSWPAAYTTQPGLKKSPAYGGPRPDAAKLAGSAGSSDVGRLYSVGSGRSDTYHHEFSAHGTFIPGAASWVTHWENGNNVPVDRNAKGDSAVASTTRSVVWSGTSFAAPRLAARLLPAADPRLVTSGKTGSGARASAAVADTTALSDVSDRNLAAAPDVAGREVADVRDVVDLREGKLVDRLKDAVLRYRKK